MTLLGFSRPLWLCAACIALILLAVLHRLAARRGQAQAITYSDLDFMLSALRPSPLPGRLLLALRCFGAVLIAAAFGGVAISVSVPVRDAVVLLCIDTSGSMRSADLAPSRARAAEAAARAFIESVPPGTRVGVLTFASNALLVQPPSADLPAVEEALTRIPAPNGATAIGDALILANEQMPAVGRRVVILLTDGVNNRGGDPIAAAQAMGKRGILVYAVGIGTHGGEELIPGTNERADIDEDALRAIAQNGGGNYAPVHDAATLRIAFHDLAGATVWERRFRDMSLPASLTGGVLLLLASAVAATAGKIP